MNRTTEILILTANPQNTSRLRLDEEVREIEEGLHRSKNREQFKIRSKWALRLRDLRRALLDYEPHIVHFCGHGEANGLVLEDELGKAVFLNPDAIEGLFELFSDKVQCVFLNACYSESQAIGISRHIPFVIGMSQGITDKAAIEFALGFYDALGAGKSFKDAFKFGRNAIQLYGIAENLIPILIENKKTNFESSSQQNKDYIFRFRAELEHDVDELRKVLSKRITKITKSFEAPYPTGPEVEIHVNLSLEELREAMRQVEDGHVMVQTVLPKDKYTGERDLNL